MNNWEDELKRGLEKDFHVFKPKRKRKVMNEDVVIAAIAVAAMMLIACVVVF